MANYAISPGAFEPSNLEATLASQLNGPAGNQLIGYLYAARLDREQGGRDYLRAVDTSQRRALASEQMKMQYDLAAALGRNPEALWLTKPGRSIIDPDAAELAEQYSLTGLEQNRANALRNYGEGVNNLAYAGVSPPMGSEYSLLGAPKVRPTQGEPIPIRLKGMGGGGGGGSATSDIATARLDQNERRIVADVMRQYDRLKSQAQLQYNKDAQKIAETHKFNATARAQAMTALNSQYQASMESIESGRNEALGAVRGNVTTSPAPSPVQQAQPVPGTARSVSTESTSNTRSADEVIAVAKRAYSQAPQNRANIEAIMKREGVPPDRFHEVFGR